MWSGIRTAGWGCCYFESREIVGSNIFNPQTQSIRPHLILILTPRIKKKSKGSMRVLEITEQQQIINVWSCTSTICKFIFYSSDLWGYFLVAERSDVQKIFARPLNSQNNKLSYQRVDMFEFGTILCFIVLLILFLPTLTLGDCFFLYSLRRRKRQSPRNVDEHNKSIGKWKRTELVLLFWDKVQSKYEHRDKGHRFNPKYGHWDT